MKPDPVRITIAWQDPAMMQIGKSGLSDGVVKEAIRLLKLHKYIKVRVLRSALGGNQTKESMLQALCDSTQAQLSGIRGNTAVIYRLKKGSA